MAGVREIHPSHPGYRLLRWMRGAAGLPGWMRLTAWLAPEGVDEDFVVCDHGMGFAGNTRSFIDRQVYLFGQYERDQIAAFLSLVPAGRRGVMLDIGANVGTHTLAFASVFRAVHAFEPNPAAAVQLRRNLSLNRVGRVAVHETGLGSTTGRFPFYLIAKDNLGLGTFMATEQYDLPLRLVGHLPVEIGDRMVDQLGLERVDAIKIDVQGLEAEVLAGLAGTLRRDRPVTWFEYDAGTRSTGSLADLVARHVPFPANLFHLDSARAGFRHRPVIRPVVDREDAPTGNYCVVPR